MKLENILRKLIRFQTVSENIQEHEKCLRWIQAQTQSLPLFVTKFSVQSFPILLFTTQKTKRPLLWLVGHIDVVPGSPSVFRPKKKGPRLFGRGTFDMKFAVACYIKLLKELGKNLSPYNFGVMLTSDEESGGANGVWRLLGKGYSSKLAVVPDGGKNWSIEKGAKGVFQLHITAKGASAHSSRTWLGSNAILLLMSFLHDLQSLFPKEPCKDIHHWHVTLNIGKIGGGEAINQVPGSAFADVDIRFPDEPTRVAIARRIDALIVRRPGIKIIRKTIGRNFAVDINTPFIKRFAEIAKETYRISPRFLFSHGTSDARFFASRGIPVIATRPKGGGHHSENEWIDIPDLERFYHVLKSFVMEISKTS